MVLVYGFRWLLMSVYCSSLVDSLTTIHPTEIQVLVGNNATFECSTSETPSGTEWLWFQTNRSAITAIANEDGAFYARYKLTIDGDGRKSTLTILNITVEDDQVQYNCQYGSVSINAKLIVITKLDSKYPVCQSDNSVVNTEKTLTLTCSASGGDPRPSLQWYRNGKNVTEYQISVDNLSYVAVLNHLLTSEDETSIFTCKAEGLAATVNQSCSITPAIPPNVTIKTNTTTFAAGDSLEFTCTVMSPWNITLYTWKYGDQPVKSTKFKLNSDNTELTISNLQSEDDEKVVRCTAMTSSGLSGNDSVRISIYDSNGPNEEQENSTLLIILVVAGAVVLILLVYFVIATLLFQNRKRKRQIENRNKKVDKPYYQETIISSEQIVSSETGYSELTPTTSSIYSELNEPKVQKK